MKYRVHVMGAAALLGSLLALGFVINAMQAGAQERWPYYTPNSYWVTPIQGAPLDPNSDHYIESWKSVSSNHNVRLGAMDGWYGYQLYFGTESDPIWTVTSSATGQQFQFRGPANMTPSPGDNELVCLDWSSDDGNGMVFAYGGIAAFPPWSQANRTGTAAFAKVEYIKSNGLDGSVDFADEPRNFGHRGLALMTFGPIVSEVQAQHIPHLIKLVIPWTGKSPYLSRYNQVWPYAGNEGNTSDVPEGSRVRLKASVQPRIDAMDNPYAQAIAQALLTYGGLIGDQGGQGVTLNMQTSGNSLTEWAAMGLTGTSLYEFTIDDFEFVELGWVPPGI